MKRKLSRRKPRFIKCGSSGVGKTHSLTTEEEKFQRWIYSSNILPSPKKVLKRNITQERLDELESHVQICIEMASCNIIMTRKQEEILKRAKVALKKIKALQRK